MTAPSQFLYRTQAYFESGVISNGTVFYWGTHVWDRNGAQGLYYYSNGILVEVRPSQKSEGWSVWCVFCKSSFMEAMGWPRDT